jgi:hypothetical protein
MANIDVDLLLKNLLGGTNQTAENKALLDYITKLQADKDSAERKTRELESVVKDLQEEVVQRKTRGKFAIDDYVIKNFKIFLSNKTEQSLQNPNIFKYDEGETAFEKNYKKFYPYQRDFIQDWAVSTQELVILYYGVGTGKSMIAVNCAEQFMNLNPDQYVYLLLPASLVLDMIRKMFQAGIDATRKHSKNGDYIYNFISYQQCLRSKLDFKEKSLLIVDEAHNLRNFSSKTISEKESGRTWRKTGDYSLVGTKLSIALLTNETKFVRTIFMTGTLLVNTPEDIEPLIALGYKKAPLTNYKLDEFKIILNDKDRFKTYFNGLISFYRKPTNAPNFPSVKFKFELLEAKPEALPKKLKKGIEMKSSDAFRYSTRNEFDKAKAKWVIDFVKKRINEKTLIYSQFIDLSINLITDYLDKEKIPYVKISGESNAKQKSALVDKYNNDEVKICVYTLAIKEGISFKETNNFICAQPYWNYAIMEQIIARGIRSDSHKNGNKSTVNCFMLVGIDEGVANMNLPIEFCKTAEGIMNNDIKIYRDEFKLVEVKTRGGDKLVRDNGKLDKYTNLADFSRDIALYITMINKQAVINEFEHELIYEVPSFEKANNIENNDFIITFNQAVIDIEQKDNRLLTIKEKMALKREMYNEYYNKEIERVSKTVVRFDKDMRYKKNRNPDVEEIATKSTHKDIIKDVKKMLDKGDSLNTILDSFKLSKQEITTFQANFTPESEVNKLIEQSGIKDDKREKLIILEPTSGIGNVINGLLNLPNRDNMMIDAVEIHNVFYQIAVARFDTISNIKLYNMDFLKFEPVYGYDYILGNPPFNLRTQIQVWNNKTEKIENVDTTLFDVNFVALAYNKLNDKGSLTMIISNRFTRDKQFKQFIHFRAYYEYLKSKGLTNISSVSQFKKSEGVSEKMETNFEMVCITLKKFKNFDINLEDPRPEIFPKEELEQIGKELKKEKAKKTRERKKAQIS